MNSGFDIAGVTPKNSLGAERLVGKYKGVGLPATRIFVVGPSFWAPMHTLHFSEIMAEFHAVIPCHEDKMQVMTHMVAERTSSEGLERIPLGEVVERVKAGEVIILRECLQALGYLETVLGIIGRVLAEMTSDDRANRILADGVEHLHRHVSGQELARITKQLQAELGVTFMMVVKRVVREILAVEGAAHAEESRNLRIFVPHDNWMEGREDFLQFERERQRGKLTLHGPHTDVWGYHPLNVINVWTAIGPVLPDNGMSFWPELFGRIPVQGEWHMARPDQVLGRPFGVALNAGDALLFHIGHMHGSRINQTDQTRFVCSARFTAGPPQLYGKPWYSYMHIDDIPDRIGAVEPPCATDRVLPDAPPSDIDTSGDLPLPVLTKPSLEPGTLLFEADAIAVGEVRPLTEDLCAARTAEGMFVFERHCPHEGNDLAAGYVHEGKIHCPRHNLGIDLKSGQSPCRSLPAIAIRPVVIEGNTVVARSHSAAH